MTASQPAEEALFNAARQIGDGVARSEYLREAAGGDEALLRRVDLDDIEPTLGEPDLELLALDEALQKLEQKHPRKAEVVKLRFFAGLTTAQAAVALGVSTSTAENDWAYARSWLRLRMSEPDRDQP